MDARVSAALKVSIACGLAIFLATLIIGAQQGWLFPVPAPAPDPGATPTPTDDGMWDIFALGIGSMLAALPLVTAGGVIAIMLSRASISSIKGSISTAILTALLSYVAWVAITVIGSLLLAIAGHSGGVSLLLALMIFLWLGLFTLIVPALMLMGFASASIAGFIYAAHVLKLS